MYNSQLNKIDVFPDGFVRLVDMMPRTTAELPTLDSAVVQAARISTGQGTKDSEKDRGLIRYLMRNKHTSPFEMVEFKFHLKMPIFVARQWMRHRMASINEYSGRYSEVPDECWIPSPYAVRSQSDVNKQSSDPMAEGSEAAVKLVVDMQAIYDKAYKAYKDALAAGIAREQARTLLPQAMYTEFYWKIDLHNLFNFLKLRMDKHAQKEIQEFAEAVYKLIKPLVPDCCTAFEDYILNAITFSRQELVALSMALKPIISAGHNNLTLDFGAMGKTEALELETKLRRIGIVSIKKDT